MSTIEQTPLRELFSNSGYCHCCRSDTDFVAYSTWLRDFYVCKRCLSIPRQRHIQAVLDTYFPEWERKIIHESSPSNDFISRYCEHYTSSHYLPDVSPGAFKDGIRSENIESLTFEDGSIDLFITQDVLEHVFNPDTAVREINRVLRRGGVHLFTTPKYRDVAKTCRRAQLGPDGSIVHIADPDYHGNPVGDGRSLVTFNFGSDFEELLSEWTGRPVQVFHTKDRRKGLDAEFNEVFVIQA
jgi:SAM-dependent methyltransferase